MFADFHQQMVSNGVRQLVGHVVVLVALGHYLFELLVQRFVDSPQSLVVGREAVLVNNRLRLPGYRGACQGPIGVVQNIANGARFTIQRDLVSFDIERLQRAG
ncbi:Uncharacterised protein [Bordetella pertussis]|nr:Uncharacterised protein [Bordetella pertussis]